MGADLIMATAPVSNEPVEELHRRADRLDSDILAEFFDYSAYEGFTEEEVREAVHFAIDDIVGDDERRDMVVLSFGDRWFYVTGGMTWGDDPTEAFGNVWLLSDTEVTNDEYWASRE